MGDCYGIIAVGFLLLGACLWRSYRVENQSCLILSPFWVFCVCEVAMAWPAVVFARMEGISTSCHAGLVVILSTVSFGIGYCWFRAASRWAGAPYWFWRLSSERGDDRSHLFAVAACAAFLVLAGLYFYQGLPPAVYGLKQTLAGDGFGTAEELAAQRLDLTKGHYFGGTYRGQGAIRALMRVGWFYLTAVALVMFLRRRTWVLGSSFVTLLGASYVFVAGDGTRGAFLWGGVGLLVTASYQAKLRLRTCIWVAACLATFLVLLSLPQKLSGAMARGTVWSEGAQQLIRRIFVGNGVHTIHAIEFVRSGDIQLRWGAIHVNDMAAALPFVNSGTPFAYELFLLAEPDAAERRTTFANTTYLGILYAEYGWAGCVIAYFALGCMIAWGTRAVFTRRKTVTNTACAGMMALYVGQISLSGATPCIVSLGVLFAFLAVFRCLVASYPRPRAMVWATIVPSVRT